MKEGFLIIDTLEIPADIDAIAKVETLIDSVCAKLGVNEDFYGNVLIAVTEAVTNAIVHGSNNNNLLDVRLLVGDESKEFCFNIKDGGRGFDYTNLADPTSPENLLKEHGRGIFLMRNLADEIVFEEGGSSVSIYFNK
jgi:serine/threonine-protein kinase RsbW